MKERFDFGKNWQKYLRNNFSEAKLQDSIRSLQKTLGLSSLSGMSFLDIGCGSGLSSLAALKMGAASVCSIDYDPYSVEAARHLHTYSGSPNQWIIQQGDVLNSAQITTLGKFDIVYSWGVLHHTGNMYQAIDNACSALAEGGGLFLALYSYTAYENGVVYGQPSPEEWLNIKQKYLNSPVCRQIIMNLQYIWMRYYSKDKFRLINILHGTCEIYKKMKNYSLSHRGMNFFRDIHDWLGGWPMEFVHEIQLQDYMKNKFCMQLIRMETGANTEFVFMSGADSKNSIFSKHAHNALANRKIISVEPPYEQVSEYVWKINVDSNLTSDVPEFGASRLKLYEGEHALFGHTPERALHALGNGRYLHKNGALFFSTSDNTSPLKNGRNYTYYIDD